MVCHISFHKEDILSSESALSNGNSLLIMTCYQWKLVNLKICWDYYNQIKSKKYLCSSRHLNHFPVCFYNNNYVFPPPSLLSQRKILLKLYRWRTGNILKASVHIMQIWHVFKHQFKHCKLQKTYNNLPSQHWFKIIWIQTCCFITNQFKFSHTVC